MIVMCIFLTSLVLECWAGDVEPPSGHVLRISLKQAVTIALAPDGSTRLKLAEEEVERTRAQAAQSRASLLPNLDASYLQRHYSTNLGILGLPVGVTLVPGFSLPELVGPLQEIDARAAVTENVLDVSMIRRFQAARVGVSAARAEGESTSDQVAAQVARFYLEALRAEAAVKTAQANVTLAEALLKDARDRQATGTGIAIGTTRAQLQLATQQQQLLVQENARDRAHLKLLRAMGLNLEYAVELTDELSAAPVETPTLEQAITEALQSRSDYHELELRQERARLNYRAVTLEQLPSLQGFADYGSLGSGLTHNLPTYSYGFQVRLPVFDGRERAARRAVARVSLREEQINIADLRQQIELDVRTAFQSLQSGVLQMKVAQEGLALAEDELAHARRRYLAEVGRDLEVADAQDRLARARDNQTEALFNYGLARIDLYAAMGTIRRMLQ
jgi:outer membrane protein TolC